MRNSVTCCILGSWHCQMEINNDAELLMHHVQCRNHQHKAPPQALVYPCTGKSAATCLKWHGDLGCSSPAARSGGTTKSVRAWHPLGNVGMSTPVKPRLPTAGWDHCHPGCQDHMQQQLCLPRPPCCCSCHPAGLQAAAALLSCPCPLQPLEIRGAGGQKEADCSPCLTAVAARPGSCFCLSMPDPAPAPAAPSTPWPDEQGCPKAPPA